MAITSVIRIHIYNTVNRNLQQKHIGYLPISCCYKSKKNELKMNELWMNELINKWINKK